MNPDPIFETPFKKNAQAASERIEAFWNRALLDRPAIIVTAPAAQPREYPKKTHATHADRWLDIEYAVDWAEAQVRNIYWGGDSLPLTFPNLGPEVIATGYGCPLEFGEYTTWSVPIITDWDRLEGLKFDRTNFFIETMMKMTRAMLERARGRWLVGHTDIHPGGDLAASLRGPQELCIDIAEDPDHVRKLLTKIQPAFEEFYSMIHDLIREYGQTMTTTWSPIYARGKFYIPSNDFSCMISSPKFKELFIPGLIEEIRFLDRSLYHLDGPQALRHLPLLLDIPELDAVQWVFGSGNGPAAKWAHVYKQIQDAGKCVQVVEMTAEDMNPLMDVLNPEGVVFMLSAASPEEADALVSRVARWTKAGKY
ncbi:hypothetical protein QPK87_15065 [Kamptonema cortianum]|nr:hypothetical protein [Oscillatoria laete-virens]MDK3157884.1 hypothetical protein [Kamptonema cortianum]MDL5046014.1 hypothetical protein [Oscillatoria amoena NRMC-F 0135]MDL5052720.1 hypothetical protein [Oscillatoria laete-virens NRMC-F 0139]